MPCAVGHTRTWMPFLVPNAVPRIAVPATRVGARGSAMGSGTRPGVVAAVPPCLPLQRAVDRVLLTSPIQLVPSEGQRFALPNTQGQGHHESNPVPPLERSGDDALDFGSLERLDFLDLDRRRLRETH